MRQTQTIQCSNKIIEKQGPTGTMGPTGPSSVFTGSSGPTGPEGITGPPADNTFGISYTQTFTGMTINYQGIATITPTLPSNFPPGVYLVLSNMQINPVNQYKLSHVSISYTGLLSDNTNTTNYASITEFNE